MITEDYVSFEVAKLLKEKGFLKEEDLRITQNLSFYDNIGLHHNLNKYYNSLILDKIYFVVAPTHQMAMKWLREKKKIFIRIIEDAFGENFHFEVYCKYPNAIMDHYIPNYIQDTYEDTVEAALKWVLENLI